MNPLRWLLLPLALLWSGVVWLRNRAYDVGLFRSHTAPVPAVVVGNLSMGGTGKTPMVLWLLSKIEGRKVAVLSRGYGRTTRGFIEVKGDAPARLVGDEPLQMAMRYPRVPIVVCEDRLAGIAQLLKLHVNTQLVILDDALQHRRLSGHFNILLTDWHRPFYADHAWPMGSLRDNRREARRAQVIVVTKCPADLSAADMSVIESQVHRYNTAAPVLFAALSYGEPVQFHGPATTLVPGDAVGAFAGIASSGPFHRQLRSVYTLKFFKSFADHGVYTPAALQALAAKSATFDHPLKALLTTEKDMARLKGTAELMVLNEWPLFYLPVHVQWLRGENELLERINAL